MYTLTLTKDERDAFDFVGGRYANGDEMSKLICEGLPIDTSWDDNGDITFNIPEHVARGIAELAKQDDESFPCFSEELTLKMLFFLEKIV